MSTATQTFSIITKNRDGDEAELYKDLSRGEALDLLDDQTGQSVVGGFLGVTLEKKALHTWESNCGRYRVDIQAVKDGSG